MKAYYYHMYSVYVFDFCTQHTNLQLWNNVTWGRGSRHNTQCRATDWQSTLLVIIECFQLCVATWCFQLMSTIKAEYTIVHTYMTCDCQIKLLTCLSGFSSFKVVFHNITVYMYVNFINQINDQYVRKKLLIPCTMLKFDKAI